MVSNKLISKLRESLNNPENIKRTTEHIEIHQEYSKRVKDYLNEKERKFQESLDRELFPYYY